MFILTNSEELVKDVFELFSKFNHPSLHGADHGRIEILLCQGLAPTAHLVYYCVKRLSRIFFKSLTPAAGRRDITDVAVGAAQSLSSPSGADQWEAQDGCWNGQQRLAARLNLFTRKRGCCIKQKHALNATASFDLRDSHKRDARWRLSPTFLPVPGHLSGYAMPGRRI